MQEKEIVGLGHKREKASMADTLRHRTARYTASFIQQCRSAIALISLSGLAILPFVTEATLRPLPE